MNASVTDGPARSAMALAVRTKRPAPMIAPMPRATSAKEPRVRLSPPADSPALASAINWSIDFVRKSVSATHYLGVGSEYSFVYSFMTLAVRWNDIGDLSTVEGGR